MAELIAEAMLDPSNTEGTLLLITLDATRFREPTQIRVAAEEVLDELRNGPPAPGFLRVEIPGERERDHRAAANGKIGVPEQTLRQLNDLALELGAI